jgi:hypothetical protein
MPRKKKTKKTAWFGFGSPPSRTKSKRTRRPTRAETIASIKKTAAVVAGLCFLAGAAVGFGYMEKYVHAASPVKQPMGALELISPPRWINATLQTQIANAAGGYDFELSNETAGQVARQLETVPWLYNVRVRTTDKTIHVHADYRKPVASVKHREKKYYLAMVRPDDPLYKAESPPVVLLDCIDLETLPIIEIKGFQDRGMPRVGGSWDSPEITTAVELINGLARMDDILCREKPLLDELASIDVSNFDGRKYKSDPHIILYAKDNTEIRWGAAYGKSRLYVEATEQEKLATLYTEYKKHNTIKFVENRIYSLVELRYAQRILPRPE